MEELTVKYLKNLKNENNENFIKKGWLDDINLELFNKDILTCINNCTSPRVSKIREKITDEDLKMIFRAFSLFPMNETKILILGQDPYPKSDKACGLAFMHKENYSNIDASLRNIYKAIWAYKHTKLFDNAKDISWNTCPLGWIKDNKVLLLNTALTYESYKQKNKHQTAWRTFIKNIIIKLITCNDKKLVVFLWGKDAQNLFFECTNSFSINDNIYNLANESTTNNVHKTKTIMKKLLCFTTSHPSPLGFWRGFKYDAPNHFKACDEFLSKDIWKNFPEQ